MHRYSAGDHVEVELRNAERQHAVIDGYIPAARGYQVSWPEKPAEQRWPLMIPEEQIVGAWRRPTEPMGPIERQAPAAHDASIQPSMADTWRPPTFPAPDATPWHQLWEDFTRIQDERRALQAAWQRNEANLAALQQAAAALLQKLYDEEPPVAR